MNDNKKEDWRKDTPLSHYRLDLEPLREIIIMQDVTAFKVVIEVGWMQNLPQSGPVHAVKCFLEINEVIE